MMKSTLEMQRRRLKNELLEAEAELKRIRESDFPNFKLMNFYTDIRARNLQLIDMIDQHLFDGNGLTVTN